MITKIICELLRMREGSCDSGWTRPDGRKTQGVGLLLCFLNVD